MANAKEAQEIVKAGSLGGFVGDDKIFTGKVKVTKLFNDAPYRPFGGGLVEFERGARSAWHTHPAGQTLIVTKGVIITGTEQGDVQIAREGDTILCPPNLKHWHGATDKQSGAHIALTGVKAGNNVNWLEKVSDEEYKTALKKAK
nr:cupin domain-containing protein [Helicobacter sp. MIT 01-3238]